MRTKAGAVAKPSGRGRPPKAPTAGKRVSLGLKVTPEIKTRLDAAARTTGRTQSQEAEIRIEKTFDRDDLLPQVLTLAYGRPLAGLLMLIASAMTSVVRSAETQVGADWTDDRQVFDHLELAVACLLTAVRPPQSPSGRSFINLIPSGRETAIALIQTLTAPVSAKTETRLTFDQTAVLRVLLGDLGERLMRAPDVSVQASVDLPEPSPHALADTTKLRFNNSNTRPQHEFEPFDEQEPQVRVGRERDDAAKAASAVLRLLKQTSSPSRKALHDVIANAWRV